MKLFFIAGIWAFVVLAGIVRADSMRSIGINVQLDSVQDRNISRIDILSSPEYDITIGNNISLSIAAYRGMTLKRTLYVWVQDTLGKRISSKAKLSLPERFNSYNLSVNLSFGACFASSTYMIVVEGLGINATRQVSLSAIGCNQTIPLTEGALSFSVLDSPKLIDSGIPFKTRILISNPSSEHLEISAWSYVYRASKCYSGEREQNRKEINVPEYSNVTFDLENTVHAPSGDYAIKVKFLQSGKKSPREINIPITVDKGEPSNSSKNNSSISAKASKLSIAANSQKNYSEKSVNATSKKRSLFDFPKNMTNSTATTVFRSASAKAAGLAVYFLIAALAILLLILILKKL